MSADHINSAQAGLGDSESWFGEHDAFAGDSIDQLLLDQASIELPGDASLPDSSGTDESAPVSVATGDAMPPLAEAHGGPTFVGGAPSLTVTRATTLTTDVDGDGAVDMGDTLTHRVTIVNSGGDAFNAILNDTLNGTTIVANTLNVSPIAFDDSFTAVGNTVLRVGGAGNIGSGPSSTVAGNLLSNDTDFFGDTFTLDTVSNGASAQGGTFNVFANGSFNYVSAAGFEGTDTFTYTIRDDGIDGIAGNADDLTSTATVSIAVGGAAGQVWYVDAGAGAGGTGTSANPFNSMTQLNGLNGDGSTNDDVDSANDYIYVKGNPTAGGIVLESGQHLVGTGSALTVGGFTLAAAGARSALTASSGNIVTLASGNEVLGLDINGTGTATGVSGTNFGTVTINNATINTAGQALSLTTGTVAGAGFSTTTSTGGTNNVALSGVDGQLNLGTGALSGATGNSVNISGGSAGVDYDGTITHAGNGSAILITSHTGGTVQFDGALTSNGASDGISLVNNTGATINFAGGLTINTSSSGTTGFTAVGGGTVNVTGSTNTINSGTGTVLAVVNTTIGASGLTFRSLSSSGGANNGITLDNTGASGGLTVTGVGTTANSGGVISNHTGADGSTTAGIGIYLNNTRNVSLSNMDIEGNQNYGIRGNNVVNFALNGSTVGVTAKNGTSVTADTSALVVSGEASVRFDNLTGTASITNSTLDQGFGRTLHITNTTAGSTLNMSVTGSTLRQSLNNTNGGDPGGGSTDAAFIDVGSTATVNLTWDNSDVTSYRQFGLFVRLNNSAQANVEVKNSDFSNSNTGHAGASAAIQVGGSGLSGGDVFGTFNIHDNTFRHGDFGSGTSFNNGGAALVAGLVSGTGTFYGKFVNNVVGVSGVAFSGAGNGADALRLFASGNNGSHGNTRYLVQGNTIQNYGEAGIQINARQGNAGIDATVIGNTIRQPGTAAQGAFASIWVNSGALAADTNTVNIAIGGTNPADKNTLVNSDPSNATDVFLDNNSDAGGATFINLYRNGSTATGSGEALIRNILVDDNNGPLDLLTGFTNQAAGQPFGTPAGLPAQAPLFATFQSTAWWERHNPVALDELAVSDQPIGSVDFDEPTQPAQPVVVDDGVLSQAELNLIVTAAIERWAAAGASADQLAAMRAVEFSVESLSGVFLGSSSAGHVTIDDNAAGFNWFVDASPGDDSEYNGAGTRLTAARGTQAGTRVDLLSTVMHELGHHIGLDDIYGASAPDDLMYGVINPGERRLPAAGEAAGADGVVSASPEFALAPVNIGTIPGGRTVTVMWRSTVDGGYANQILPTFTNTSTLSGSNFANVTSNTETLTLDSLTLGNLVFFDANRNGVFDAGDSGLSGVTVNLFADADNNNIADGASIATTTTNGSGNYSFTGLAPGNYIVSLNTSAPSLAGLTSVVGVDPDNNVDNDSNARAPSGGAVASQSITLAYNAETTADGTGQLDINNTLDFAFVVANQPPVNTIGGAVSVNEDTAIALTGMSITDDGAAGDTYTVLLTVRHGFLAIRTDVAGGITAANVISGNTGTNGVTVTGTLAAINATLAAANGLTYQGDLNYFGADSVTMSTWEGVRTDAASIAAPATLTTGTTPVHVITADINADGKADLLYTLGGTGQVAYRLGVGDGTFGVETSLAGANGATSVAVGDVDGDGRADIVVANNAGAVGANGSVGVYYGTGGGAFGAIQSLGNLPQAYDVALVDLNNDGRLDIIGDRRDVGQSWVYLQTATPRSFSAATIYSNSPSNYTKSIITGDFNNDGLLDLVAANPGNSATGNPPGSVTIRLGAGAGALGNLANVANSGSTNIRYWEAAAADLNNDGNLDLVVSAIADPSGITVFLGDGAGNFANGVAYSTGSSNTTGIQLRDINGDGIVDALFTTQGNPGTTGWRLGNGDGTFQAAVTVAGGFNPESLAVADFNGDGLLDFASVAQSDNSLRVFLNTGNYFGDVDTRAITVNPVNDAPVVDLNGAAAGIDTTATYAEGAASVKIATGVTLSDVDNTTLTGATVTIGAGFVVGDILRMNGTTTGTNPDGIAASYNAATGILTLSGNASVAAYQAALATLNFKTNSDNPGTSRDITVTVTDGTTPSTAAHIVLTVSPENDAPVNSVPGAQTGTSGSQIIFSSANGNALSVSDPDAGAATIRVKLNADHGSITLSGTGGLTVAGDGSHSIVILGSVTAINAALNGLRYQGDSGYVGSDGLTITTNDRGNTGSGGPLTDSDTVTITLSAAAADLQHGKVADHVVGGFFSPANIVSLPPAMNTYDLIAVVMPSDAVPAERDMQIDLTAYDAASVFDGMLPPVDHFAAVSLYHHPAV